MTNSIEKGSIPENQENKIEQELNIVFSELINNAKRKLKEKEDYEKEHPELIGEGPDPDWGENTEDFFWMGWEEKFPYPNFLLGPKLERIAKEKQIELYRNNFPSLYEEAIKNYNKFVEENRWGTAEEWEKSGDDQFLHLIEEVRKNFKKRLNDLEKND